MGNKHGCCVYPGGRNSSRSSHQKSLASTNPKSNKLNQIVILRPASSLISNSLVDSHKNLHRERCLYDTTHVLAPNNQLSSSLDPYPYSTKEDYPLPNQSLTYLPRPDHFSSFMSNSSSRDFRKSYQHSLPSYRVHTTYFPCSSSFSEATSTYNPAHQGNNSSWGDVSYLSLPTPKHHHVSHCKTHSEPLCAPSYCQMTSFHPCVPPKQGTSSSGHGDHRHKDDKHKEEAASNLQHISEREPDDLDQDPSLHPTAGPLFLAKSKQALENGLLLRRRSRNCIEDNNRALKKSSSCSTIYLDDSTVSQPNLKNTIKCVALAIYYHIKFRTSSRIIDIFDEKLHPLTRDGVHADYDTHNPEQRHIYKFVRTLFNAAQLTAECAIITLVYLERLITYADIDMTPGTWKRIVLGAIILASKVWDDQAVWNVDYCQILRDISVDDMNELERQYLVLVQFNINVPSSVYAKYYFALRSLAEANDMAFPSEPLSRERAAKLEAMARLCEDKYAQKLAANGHKKWSSLDNVSSSRKSVAILS